MKKLCALILALVITFSFAACGEGGGSGQSVAVFYYTYSDPYISTVRASLSKSLEDLGVEYQEYDSNSSQTTQAEQVQTAITKGATCLVVNIVETGSDDAAEKLVQQAKSADIPIIFFNREVSDKIVSSYDKCAFVGTDAAEAGHMQGELIAKFLLENYGSVDINGDGKISYVLFKGQDGNAEAEYRTKYAVEDANRLLSDAGKPPLSFYNPNNRDRYLVDKNGNWSAAAANEYMTTILTEYTEKGKNMVECVICNNDGMAEGAITALNTAGYNDGKGRTIPVFGVDATEAAQELIRAGKMTGTIKQDAQGMAETISHLARNIAGGKGLLDGTESMNVDENVAKIRVPYGIFTGE
ncbi:MAG: galactose ABC transporter substrate-binding protein [Oscillospiraceae bacterium]|nr:galactose ABC transporter substrate-binding protein [Oscillospiraceae bacterium]